MNAGSETSDGAPVSRIRFEAARFVVSVARLSGLPADRGREAAFAGRSNAGKSSAINALTRHGSLARVSKTPGRTQQINFFALSEVHRLVDLPGYGYARAPANVKRAWASLVEGYLARRRSLTGLVVLMDSRRPFMGQDEQLVEWARAAGLPIHVLLTKCDKLSRSIAARTLDQARRRLGASEVAGVQLFSATRKSGLEALESRLTRWLSHQEAG